MKKVIISILCVMLFNSAWAVQQSNSKNMNLAALPECVDHDQTCVLNGTECCDYPQYKCQGTFPNTTCQPASG